MVVYLCVTPQRKSKTSRIMNALAEGIRRVGRTPKIVLGPPPHNENPFVVWGQIWTSEIILPEAIRERRPFWYVDNGYWDSAKGGITGYYRLTYRSMTPILLRDPPVFRNHELGGRLKPWRKDGDHVVIAMPGALFGRAIGIDVTKWISEIESKVRSATRRKIIVRTKLSQRPIEQDLENAWALVTHSSNTAVDAVIRGIPVFVALTSSAAPVGRVDLAIEHPEMPDRTHWLNSLMCQQFTLDEMQTPMVPELMRKIAMQVDEGF